jgi:hypothetical protein
MRSRLPAEVLSAFLGRVRSALMGHPQGVLLSELSRKVETDEEASEVLYCRLLAWAQPDCRDAHGLAFWRLQPGAGLRVYLVDEPFAPPTAAEHKADVQRAKREARQSEQSRVLTGLSRVDSGERYRRPRKAVHHCERCQDLPHRRPESGGACLCGRVYQAEQMPPLPERDWSREVVP